METSNNGMPDPMAERARKAEERRLNAIKFNAEEFQQNIYTFASGKLELRPGVFNEDFDQLLWKHDVLSAGFVTAWNPIMKHLWDRENDLLNYKLSHWLTGYTKRAGFVKVLKRKPGKGWFVFDIDKRHLRMLGRKFDQAVILHVNRGQAPQIVFTTVGIRRARAVQIDLLNCRTGSSPRLGKKLDKFYSTPRVVINFGRMR